MGDMADDLRDWEYRQQRPYDPFFDRPPSKTVLVWTTHDGRRIPLPEMSTEHLTNTHKLLLRKSLAEIASHFEEELRKRNNP